MLAQEMADGLDALGKQIVTISEEVKNVEAVLASQASPNQVPDVVVQAFGRLKQATSDLVGIAAALPAAPAPAPAPTPSAADGTPGGSTSAPPVV